MSHHAVRAVPPALDTLAVAVCVAARRLLREGLAVGTAGNVSARDPTSGLIAMTPAGCAYGTMTPADIAIVDPAGHLVRGDRRPTSELALHVDVLALRPDDHAIVHTHSPYAAAFSVARHPIPLVSNEGLFVGTPRVEIAEFAPPGTAALGRAAVHLLTRFPAARAFLLANHGVVALGPDVERAFLLAAQVEWEARIYHLALQLGEPHVLTQAQMAEIVRHYANLPPVERSTQADEP